MKTSTTTHVLRVQQQPGTVGLGKHFRITRTGLEVNGKPTLNDFALLGHELATLERAVQFAIGDFLLYVEREFGEQGSQVIDPDCGWTEESLRVYRWVAERVPPARRQPTLSFQHHKVAAKLAPEVQQRWLHKAAHGGWSSAQMLRELRGAGDVTTTWLLVLCADEADAARLQCELESKGRTCKVTERRGGQPMETSE